MMIQTLNSVMHERRSIRSYDDTYTISKEKILEMLQEAASAPSAHNLQPWRFIIIDELEEKKAVRKIAWNQEQVETASVTIAIVGDTQAYKKAEAISTQAVSEGLMTEEGAQNYLQKVEQVYPHVSQEVLKDMVRFDGGLIAMQFMLVAKANGLDTVCIGGFDKEAFAKYYQLDSQYVPLVLISVGKAKASGYQTVRLKVEDLMLK